MLVVNVCLALWWCAPLVPCVLVRALRETDLCALARSPTAQSARLTAALLFRCGLRAAVSGATPDDDGMQTTDGRRERTGMTGSDRRVSRGREGGGGAGEGAQFAPNVGQIYTLSVELCGVEQFQSNRRPPFSLA